MLFLDKMLRHLHAIPSSWSHFISASWDYFHQPNPFLQKVHQRLRSRTPPAYLVLAACLTTLASVILLSLGRIRYHWDSKVWDVDTIRPQDIVIPSTPRELAANNTLGVSPTTQPLYDHDDLTICFDSFRSCSRWPKVPLGAREDFKRRRRSRILRLISPFNHLSQTNSSALSWTLGPNQASIPTGARH